MKYILLMWTTVICQCVYDVQQSHQDNSIFMIANIYTFFVSGIFKIFSTSYFEICEQLLSTIVTFIML